MNLENYRDFRETLREVQQNMDNLKTQLHVISGCLAEGRLVPDDVIDAAADCLGLCKKREESLRTIAEKMNIATDQTIEVMRTQAAALEKSEQLARVHRIVMDYFRLTAYAEETIRVLEESKKKLMALCASIQTDEDELLRPYDVAVNEVCNASEMNQDNFFFIADQLGRKIAWEIDKKRIVLKEDADISAYLDGSCEILQAEGMLLNQPAEHVQPAQEQADEAPETPTNQPTIAGKQENADAVNPSETTPSKEDEVTSEETNDTDTPPKLQDDEPKVENGQKRAATPGNSETIAEKQSSSEEKNVDASAANKEEQPKAETEEKVPGTWEGFSSYLDEKITVGVANDKESEKAAENQFLKKIRKEHTPLPITPIAIAAMRLIPTAKETSLQIFGQPIQKVVQYLQQNGYAADYVFQVNGVESKYFTLSSKIIACLKKDNVQKEIRKTLRVCPDFKNALEYPSKWSPSFAYRCKLLADYALQIHLDMGYEIEALTKNKDYPYARIAKRNGGSYLVLPFVVRSGEEEQLVKAVITCLSNEKWPVLLLVKAASAIALLNQAICVEHEEFFSLVRYAVIGQPEVTLDGKMQVVPQLSNASVDEKTEIEPKKEEEQPPERKKPAQGEAENPESAPENPAETTQSGPETDTGAHPQGKQPEQNTNTNADEQLANARRAFVMHRPDVGNVILKGICEENPDYQQIAQQYAYASGDPMTNEECTVAKLIETYSEQTQECDLLKMAAWLRLYFSDDAQLEWYTLPNSAQQQLEESQAYQYAPALRDVTHTLNQWVSKQRCGVDDAVLDATINQMDRAKQIEKIQHEANELLNGQLQQSNHYLNRIIEMRKRLFGPESKVHGILSIIGQNKSENLPEVIKNTALYISLKQGIVEINAKEISNLMDNKWYETREMAKGKGRNDELTGVERTTLRKQLENIFQTIGKWILAVNDDGTVAAKRNEMVQWLNTLQNQMQRALDELTQCAENTAAMTILKDTVDELVKRLEGVQRSEKSYYIRLLEEPFVALDVNYLPYIETAEEQITPFAFCARAAKYLDAPQRTWSEVIQRLFSITASRKGMDYGCAQVLKNYLEETDKNFAWPTAPEFDIVDRIKKAQNVDSNRGDNVQLWEKNFQAQIEMADGDGWFPTMASREKILCVKSALRKNYYPQCNYGFYGRAMIQLLDYAKEEAKKLRASYEARVNQLRETQEENSEAEQMLKRIENLIQEDCFGAVESYLQQAERGEWFLSDCELENDESHFRKFLNQHDDLLQNTILAPNIRMCQKFRKSHPERNSRNATGEELLQVWPESQSSSYNMQKLLEKLNLNAKVQESDKTGFRFHAVFLQSNAERAHHFAAFGSNMFQRGLDIVIICGNMQASTLIEAIRGKLQQQTNSPVLILVNCSLQLSERRALAWKITHELNTQIPFIVVDRMLAMYIAGIPLNERWKVLLQCALPIQLLNPYSENSSVKIPPEMFIGRNIEFDAIVNPNGANLIYGGRQLGKTALLRYAEEQKHRPTIGNWAIFADVKGKNCDEAARTIAKELVYKKYIDGTQNIATWDELMSALEERLRRDENELHYLLLLIDEADTLLKDSEKKQYRPIDQIKQLQSNTNGRFKFVMAGLHNVLRFSKKALANNSSVPQLQGITIKPLSFADARQLLEEPLSYLGFKIPKGEKDIIARILYNTNYFPGLVHFYASRLVKYKQKYAVGTEPPYILDRDVLTSVLADEEFRQRRVERLKMTLGIGSDEGEPPYYDMIAHMLCYCSYEADDVMSDGMTAEEVWREFAEMEVGVITALSIQQLRVLMDELVEMNIFRKTQTKGETRYLFSRTSFIEMLGDTVEVQNHLSDLISKNEGIK